MLDFTGEWRRTRTAAATLAAIRTPVMNLGADGIVTAVNPAMADLIRDAANGSAGIRAETIVGRHVDGLCRDEDGQSLAALAGRDRPTVVALGGRRFDVVAASAH
jgi:methyl-accepting chemotaxis protein